jgi:tRNA threonylcarbamoyladenosine biosynthesis protein TsaE
VLLLHGDLGAGKTTLTQGIAAGLGIEEPVQSPTFILVSEHPENRRGVPLFHLDLYRLDGADLESTGWEDLIARTDALVVVEWPERAADWLPESYLLIQLEQTGPDLRRLIVEAFPEGNGLAGTIEHLQRLPQATA